MTQEGKQRSITIAVIGDVHELWEPGDGEALQNLGVDLALFVGDFGNESVEVVRAIAEVPVPKAVILGNHDAWYSATEWGLKRCPYDRLQEDWVEDQLQLLGETHVGYGKLDFPGLGLSVVGSRPFSWGGSTWRNGEFYTERYSVENFEQSTSRIVDAVKEAAWETVLMIGHCGPTGLGDRPEDPCGKDWQPIGGDYGDPDFAAAIAQAKRLGKRVSLVACGHMHHSLRHTKTQQRRSLHIDADNTIYLNAACVPRITKTDAGHLHNFSLVTLRAGAVERVSRAWVTPQGAIAAETILFERATSIAQGA